MDFNHEKYEKAYLLVRQKKFAEAEEIFKNAIKDAIAKGLSNVAAMYYGSLGSLMAIQKKYELALPLYEKAIEYDPENLEFKLSRALYLEVSMKYEIAISYIDEVINKHTDMNNENLLYFIRTKVFCYIGMSNFKEAKNSVAEILEFDPCLINKHKKGLNCLIHELEKNQAHFKDEIEQLKQLTSK